MKCPVCEQAHTHLFMHIDGVDYWRCTICEATYLDPVALPSRARELAEYQLHNNDVADAGYRHFLAKVATPLLARLAPAQSGLDFGCGPGALLAEILREAGHQIAVYDPFFAPDTAVLQAQYDFITCTEVAEHFHQPASEFRRLNAMLKPGGWLAIMTCFQTDDARFANWHYRRDPTHVVFYRAATLRYLAQQYGWECEIPCPNVALLKQRTT